LVLAMFTVSLTTMLVFPWSTTAEIGEGDFNHDSNVDGSDLSVQIWH
jgi:hypothetical protein